MVGLLGSLNGLSEMGSISTQASLISWGIDNLRVWKGSFKAGERSDRVFCLCINYPGSQLVLPIISQLSNDCNSLTLRLLEGKGIVLILKKNRTLGGLNLRCLFVLGVKDDALS